MKLLSFESYNEYKNLQTTLNKEKLTSIWVTNVALRILAEFLNSYIPKNGSGICHGVRTGYEVTTLRQLTGMDIIGTDISDTVSGFCNIIQWDFHNIKNEWLNKMDFIYSNSWDHSYNPVACFNSWLKCLNPNGICIVHWSINHTGSSVRRADCFGADKDELVHLLKAVGVITNIIKVQDGTSLIIVRRANV